MADAARASVNVQLDSSLLSRLATRVGAPRSLTIHRLVDLSRNDNLRNNPREVEAQVSHELAEAQSQAALEVQSCRFRPQPNVLISLRLQRSTLGDPGLMAVAQALLLRAPITLHVLSLAAVGCGDVGVASLIAAISATNAVQIVSLDLSGNSLTARAGGALAQLLAAPKQKLQQLCLSSNQLGDNGAAALANGLVGNNALTSLSLGRNGIGSSGVAALAGALRSQLLLNTLMLDGNNLNGDSGCEAVTQLLMNARCLQRLAIGGNALGVQASAAIAAAMNASANASPHNGSGGNGLDGHFIAAAVVSDLAVPRSPTVRSPCLSLRALYLERAQLHDGCAGGVCELLTSHLVNLHQLYLGGNGLTDESALQIAAVLGHATPLRRLWLERNRIGIDGGAALLSSALELVRAAGIDLGVELNLTGNAMTLADYQVLQERTGNGSLHLIVDLPSTAHLSVESSGHEHHQQS